MHCGAGPRAHEQNGTSIGIARSSLLERTPTSTREHKLASALRLPFHVISWLSASLDQLDN
jgi:hypothetical protein